jgi:hypothetical protein
VAAEYSWLYITGSTVLSASNNHAAQSSALNSGLTDPAHTFSSTTGFTVGAGLYLVWLEVWWNATSTTGRIPGVYDGTSYYLQSNPTEQQIDWASTTESQTFLVQVASSAAIRPAFSIATTTASIRTIASGNNTKMSIRKLA